MASATQGLSVSGTNFLNHSASFIRYLSISNSQSDSLVMPDHRFYHRHHFHHLSPLLSLTPDSKHTYFTNHFHHSLSVIDHPCVDFAVRFLPERDYVTFEYAVENLSVVVCLSVTFVHPTQPVQLFRNVSTPFCTQAIR